jgi:hypothetical protein
MQALALPIERDPPVAREIGFPAEAIFLGVEHRPLTYTRGQGASSIVEAAS